MKSQESDVRWSDSKRWSPVVLKIIAMTISSAPRRLKKTLTEAYGADKFDFNCGIRCISQKLNLSQNSNRCSLITSLINIYKVLARCRLFFDNNKSLRETCYIRL